MARALATVETGIGAGRCPRRCQGQEDGRTGVGGLVVMGEMQAHSNKKPPELSQRQIQAG